MRGRNKHNNLVVGRLYSTAGLIPYRVLWRWRWRRKCFHSVQICIRFRFGRSRSSRLKKGEMEIIATGKVEILACCVSAVLLPRLSYYSMFFCVYVANTIKFVLCLLHILGLFYYKTDKNICLYQPVNKELFLFVFN